MGQAYDEAEAAYLLDGEDLERRLAELRLSDDPAALQRRLLGIDLRHGRLGAYEHDLAVLDATPGDNRLARLDVMVRHGRMTARERDRALVEMEHPEGLDREMALLDVDMRHGAITACERDRRAAGLRDEPWIGIKDHGFDPEQGLNGVFFEFDWNDRWIEFLRLNGYVGQTEEEVVEQWFRDVCRSQSEGIPPNGSQPLGSPRQSD